MRTLVFSAVGVFLATRRPANPIGWLLVAVGLLNALQLLCGEYAVAAFALGPERLPYGPTAEWLSALLQYTPCLLLFFLILLFPTGRLLSSRWRIVAWVGACVSVIGGDRETSVPLEASSLFDNPFGVDAAILGPVSAVANTLSVAALLGALLSLILRLHRSRGRIVSR